jgi:uncharacterized membrane protein
MFTLIAGVITFALTAAAFMALRPKGEKLHRWANTEWEPYIAVALCGGVALGSTMVVSALITMYG